MRSLPKITKNLLIINVIVWLFDLVLGQSQIDLTHAFGLWYFGSPNFHIWQPLTYMFMHGGFSHLFFNMFALWMFGSALENHWGSRRYLIYYLATGIGAGLFQELVWWLMGIPFHVTVGASGAVYGILLAFGWLFPNTKMFIIPFPFPIKAKWLVLGYFFIELFSGFTAADNVAHFAHLGGMLFGVGLILYWKRNGLNTGEGLIDMEKIKAWWQRVTHSTATHNSQSSDSQRFHYHDPIREDQPDPEEAKRKAETEKEINRILDKIKMHGYDSLTSEEKQTLFKR